MKQIGKVYIILVSVLCFMHYPLALIAPYGSDLISNVFYFEFPHLFTASALSLCYVVLNIEKVNIKSTLVKVLFLGQGFIFLSFLINGSTAFSLISISSFIFIPLGCSIAFLDKTNKSILVFSIALLFSISLVLSLFLGKTGFFPGFGNFIGISANRNWYSATLIGSFPFAIYVFYKYLPVNYFRIVTGLVSFLTLWKLWQAETRSVLPALLVCSLIFVWHYFSIKKAAVLASVFVLSGVLLVTFKFEGVKSGLNRDIRVPLTQSAIEMALDAPVFGHGPGSFSRIFPTFINDALKRKEVLTPAQEHPHNELLLLATTVGLVTVFCWLFLIFLILKKNKDRKEYYALYSVAILFIMGLTEKLLIESPSALIFPVAIGCCLSEIIGVAPDKKLFGQKYRKLLATASLFLFALTLSLLMQKVPSAWYAYKGEILKDRFKEDPKWGNLNKLMEAYSKSSDADPQNIKAAYTATSLGLQYYDDINVGRKFLLRLVDLAPDYSDTHYKKAVYYEKLGRILGEEDRRKNFKEAELSILKNVEMNPYDIDRIKQTADFFARIGEYEKCSQWIEICTETVREKTNIRFSGTNHLSLNSGIENWKNKALQYKYEHPFKDFSLTYNRSLDFRYLYKSDYIFNKYFSNSKLVGYPASQYNSIDVRFWSESLLLHSKVSSLQDIFKILLSIKVEKSGLKWPLQTLEESSGSVLSISSLACALNNLLGNSSVLLRDKGKIVCLLYDKNKKLFLLDCETGVKIESTFENFNSSKEIQKQLNINAENAEYSIFAYPQAFCFKNQVLSAIVSMDETIPDFSESPSLQLIKVRELVGGRPIGLLVDFRTLLEQELNSKK